MSPKPMIGVKSITTNLIRLILILTFIFTLNTSRTLVQTVAIIAILITFIPTTLKKLFNIEIPAAFEIIYLMFIYGLLTLGELRGYYSGIWWWNIPMSLTASIALGFVALAITHTLYKTNRINASPILAAIFIFSFTVSISVIWEIFEFTLDTLIHSGLQKSLIDTMQDLSINILGALLVSIAGASHIKNGNSTLSSKFLTTFLEKNLPLISPKQITKDLKIKILDLIQAGETDKIEFKSSLRKNLHTNEFDKKIEFSILKTITAFLNTKGGNLLIGVDDKGNIIGLENDNFQNNDKTALHLTNLIKHHIGNQFLPFIKFKIIQIKDKKIIMVTCQESRKRVFLKTASSEEFYVRNGPASIKLEGNSLVDYIQHKFQK